VKRVVIFVYSSVLGDIRLWVGPRIEHLLSTWDLTPTLSLSSLQRLLLTQLSVAYTVPNGHTAEWAVHTSTTTSQKCDAVPRRSRI